MSTKKYLSPLLSKLGAGHLGDFARIERPYIISSLQMLPGFQLLNSSHVSPTVHADGLTRDIAV